MTVSLVRRVVASRLLFLSLITSLDGSIVVLAASGGLSTLAGAIVAGLTVVGGVGCWLAARAEYGERSLGRRDYAALTIKGTLVLASTVASAWIGLVLGASTGTLRLLPIGGGIAFAILALEVSGVDVPRVARMPAAVAVLGLFAVAEVGTRWIP